jgi:hypothetical protein
MVCAHQHNRQGDQVTDALLLTATMIGVGAAAFLVARSPSFWFGLAKIVLGQLMPNIWRIVKPKNFTKEQLDKIARGQDPFRERPKGE